MCERERFLLIFLCDFISNYFSPHKDVASSLSCCIQFSITSLSSPILCTRTYFLGWMITLFSIIKCLIQDPVISNPTDLKNYQLYSEYIPEVYKVERKVGTVGRHC